MSSTYQDKILDRRLTHRHSLRIPVRLRDWGSSSPDRSGESIDISERGALVRTDLPLRAGALIDLWLKLPEEITGQPTTEWRCKGRVVRINDTPSLSYPSSVGVHFEWLDVLRSPTSRG